MPAIKEFYLDPRNGQANFEYDDGTTKVVGLDQASGSGGGASTGPAQDRVAIAVSSATTLSAEAHDGAVLHLTGAPLLTINTGLGATFGVDLRGSFTTAGTATIADERTAGAIYPYASLIPQPTAGSFVLVGSKL